MNRTSFRLSAAAAVLVAGAAAVPAIAAPPAETTVAVIAKESHFHGIGALPGDPSRFFLASHHGLYLVNLDGQARLVSPAQDDFMGFTPHPTAAGTLFSSGHPARGGNTGFLRSINFGQTWTKLSDGVGGPVDFHQMDVSRANPQVVYGVYAGMLQRSDDGGQTFRRIGRMQNDVINIGASAVDANTLFAATERGLLRSVDGGQSWAQAHPERRPATVVRAGPRGDMLAFIAGVGLVRATEPDLRWEVVSNTLGDEVIMHLAVEPAGAVFFAATVNGRSGDQSIRVSQDGGRTWKAIGK